MPWKTINEILGLAATDDEFACELLISPIEAAQKHGYRLTKEELEAFQMSRTDNLSYFCQDLLRYLPDSDL